MSLIASVVVPYPDPGPLPVDQNPLEWWPVALVAAVAVAGIVWLVVEFFGTFGRRAAEPGVARRRAVRYGIAVAAMAIAMTVVGTVLIPAHRDRIAQEREAWHEADDAFAEALASAAQDEWGVTLVSRPVFAGAVAGDQANLAAETAAGETATCVATLVGAGEDRAVELECDDD